MLCWTAPRLPGLCSRSGPYSSPLSCQKANPPNSYVLSDGSVAASDGPENLQDGDQVAQADAWQIVKPGSIVGDWQFEEPAETNEEEAYEQEGSFSPDAGRGDTDDWQLTEPELRKF